MLATSKVAMIRSVDGQQGTPRSQRASGAAGVDNVKTGPDSRAKVSPDDVASLKLLTVLALLGPGSASLQKLLIAK